MYTKYSLEIDLLKKMSIFNGVSDDIIVELLDSSPSVLREYKKGDFLAIQNDICKSLYILYSGELEGYMTGNDGKKIVVDRIISPILVAPNFIFATKNNFPVTAEVKTDFAKVVVLNKDSFLDFMMKYKVLLNNYLKVLSDRSVFLTSKLKDNSLKSLSGRLAKYLYKNSENIGTQQQIADLLGVARPSIARVIKKFAIEGYIEVKNRKIIVPNIEKLKKIF